MSAELVVLPMLGGGVARTADHAEQLDRAFASLVAATVHRPPRTRPSLVQAPGQMASASSDAGSTAGKFPAVPRAPA